MGEKWEINRVSTPERILYKINTEMPHPVGILVFGADCGFKNRVTDMITAGVADNIWGPGYMTKAAKVKFLLNSGFNTTIVLDSDDSSNHIVRHCAVKMLQNAGAKSVLGIYVEPNGSLEEPNAEAARQALMKEPPTADGLRYLIVAKEECDE